MNAQEQEKMLMAIAAEIVGLVNKLSDYFVEKTLLTEIECREATMRTNLLDTQNAREHIQLEIDTIRLNRLKREEAATEGDDF